MLHFILWKPLSVFDTFFNKAVASITNGFASNGYCHAEVVFTFTKKVWEDKLLVYNTRKGDTPERILLTTIDLTIPAALWRTTTPIEVLKPEKEWEGASLPL